MRTTTTLLIFLGACAGGPPPDGTPPLQNTPVTGPICNPAATFTEAHPVEGDTVSATLTCTSGEDIGNYTVTPFAPSTATWDAATATISWPTDLDDAGRVELFAEIKGTASVAETLIEAVWITDAYGEPGNTPPDPLAYEEEFGTDVLSLEFTGSIGDIGTPAVAYWHGDAYDVVVSNWSDADAGNAKRDLYLLATTSVIDWNDGGVDDRTQMVFWSNAEDASYARQRLGSETWERLREGSATSPGVITRSFFVVIYVNGTYHGLFTANEIPDLEAAKDNALTDTTRIWDAVSDDANYRYTTAAGQPKVDLAEGYQKVAGIPVDNNDEIVALVDHAAGTALGGFWPTAASWISTEELLDWMIFARWAALEENLAGGTVMMYDPLQAYFHVLPWDYAASFGRDGDNQAIDPSFEPDLAGANQLFEHVEMDAGASSTANSTFILHTAATGPLNGDEIQATLDEWWLKLDPSAARDQVHWGGAEADYTSAKNALSAWVADRHTHFLMSP